MIYPALAVDERRADMSAIRDPHVIFGNLGSICAVSGIPPQLDEHRIHLAFQSTDFGRPLMLQLADAELNNLLHEGMFFAVFTKEN